MAHPTFGETGAKIDFGFDNNDADDFRSVVRIIPGAIEKRRAEFAFPGIDGVSVQLPGIGARGRRRRERLSLADVDPAGRRRRAGSGEVGRQAAKGTILGRARSS